MPRLLSILVLAIGLIAETAPENARAAPAASGRTVNATQQRENRANADRWSRDSGSSASKKDDHADREDDEDKADDKRRDKDEIPKHPGELNGKLDLGDW